MVALVTGASGGVGAAVVRALAGEGYAVALLGRDERRLAAVAADVRGAWTWAGDLTQPGAAERAAAEAAGRLGTVDVLVNAAGTFGPIAPLHRVDPDAWTATLRLNVEVPLRLCRAVLPGMLARRWGRIVNVSSAAALGAPAPLNSAYVTSKVALNQLTRQLAVELAATGVTANVLHPGEVKTAMWEEIQAAAAQAGPLAGGLASWAEMVERTGGDPPERAAGLVLEIVRSERLNGAFLGVDSTPVQLDGSEAGTVSRNRLRD